MALNLCITELRKQLDYFFFPGCLVSGVCNVSKHLVFAEEGESKHFMPFPPIVWLTIDDVFFLTCSLMPCTLETILQGPGEDLITAECLMKLRLGSFFLSFHKTLASLFFLFFFLAKKEGFSGPYSGAACHAFSAL